MRTVYLAGLISTNAPESLAWREIADGLLAPYFNVINPLRGKKNLESLTTDGGITTTITTSKDILIRDYTDLTGRVDILLVHLENFGDTRPLVGTIAELAWAWEHRIPVLAICNADNYLMRKHPFISEFVTHYFEELHSAVDFLNLYWQE